jgi:hypothetical protein
MTGMNLYFATSLVCKVLFAQILNESLGPMYYSGNTLQFLQLIFRAHGGRGGGSLQPS